MISVNPWFSKKGVIRPSTKIVIAGDSISVTGPSGWAEELINESKLLYGASTPTWVIRGTPGASMASYLSGGYAATVAADAPNLIIVEMGENGVISNRAGAKADALALIDYWLGAIPGVKIIWAMAVWSGGTELWGPSPNQTRIDNVTGGIQDACLDRNLPFIGVRSRFLQAMIDLNSPAQGVASGITTSDALHPNWRGRPMVGVEIRRNIMFADIVYPAPDYATWQPNADVTPILWIEADQLSLLSDNDLLATWGAWTAAGTARPTYKATGWFNGAPCVRFNGTTNVMNGASYVAPTGATTIFAVYKLNAFSGFGAFQVLTCLKATSGIYTQFAATYNFGANYTEFDCNAKSSFSDGFFTIGSSAIVEGGGVQPPYRVGATFAGGSSTDVANYAMYWGGGDALTPLVKRNSSALTPSATAINALGARVDNGSTASEFFGGDLAALLVYPGVLSAVQFARVDEYLRRKYGP